MQPTTIVTVDLTGAQVRVGIQRDLSDRRNTGVRSDSLYFKMSPELPFPWSVAIQKTPQGLVVIAGSAAEKIIEGSNTLLFDNLRDDIAQINDEELQASLFGGFWRELGEYLVQRELLIFDEQAFAFVIYPCTYPLALLNVMRVAGGGEARLRLSGFVPEAVALLLGARRTDLLPPVSRSGLATGKQNICLILAHSDDEVEAVRFSMSGSEISTQLTLFGYVRCNRARLAERLRVEDWQTGDIAILAFNEKKLPPSSLKELEDDMPSLMPNINLLQLPSNISEELKRLGAMHIASCVMGRGHEAQTYQLTIAQLLGLQINDGDFLPLMSGNRRDMDYPFVSWKAFQLSKNVDAPFSLGFYAGLSADAKERALLGQVTLSPADLNRTGKADAPLLFALVRLDAPGSGELTLGQITGDRILWRIPFMLPGVVN